MPARTAPDICRRAVDKPEATLDRHEHGRARPVRRSRLLHEEEHAVCRQPLLCECGGVCQLVTWIVFFGRCTEKFGIGFHVRVTRTGK